MPEVGTRVRHTRNLSGALNMTRRKTRSDRTRDKGGSTYMSTGIAFVAPDTITDSGNGLGVFSVGQTLQVIGSAKNTRWWKILTVAAGTITISSSQVGGVVTAESAGPTIRLKAV